MDFSKFSEKELCNYKNGANRAIDVKRFKYTEGKAAGMNAVEVKTISGLQVLILPDKGLDIGSVTFEGVDISFLSKNGITSPAYADMQPDGFVKSFTGGMLTTCGLRSAGPSCVDVNGEYFPIHGYYSLQQAEEVSVSRPDQYSIIVSGIINETSLFGNNLSLKRQIKINDKELSISVTDELVNNSASEEEIMIIYHYNFGFPFLQDGCEVKFQDNDKVTPRTAEAASGINEYKEICAPIDGYQEQVFFHEQEGDADGFASAEVRNTKLGIAAQIKYDTTVLPVLVQWKSMASGDYALGIEPSNNYVKGRKEERENGSLKKIGSFEEKTYKTVLKIKKI